MGTELTYFSLLGISEDASQEELEARYEELAKIGRASCRERV